MVMINKNCGIYKITSPTGRIYIGQSSNLSNRWKQYQNLKNTVKQIVLHKSFLKYGVKNHQFDIIEYCSEDELNCSERFWQDEFNVLDKNGLNCMLTECGQKRKVLSDDTKLKLSDSKKGNLNPNFGKVGKDNPFWGKRGLSSKSIPVIDIVTGIRYKSIGEASEKLEICKSKLKYSLNGTYVNKTNIRYVEDFDNGVERELKISKSQREVINTVSGEIYKTVKEAAEANNISKNTLSDWLNGKYENKSKLKFVSNESNRSKPKNVGIKVKDTESGVVYNSMSEAAKELNINLCNLRYWLKEGNQNKSTLIKYQETKNE